MRFIIWVIPVLLLASCLALDGNNNGRVKSNIELTKVGSGYGVFATSCSFDENQTCYYSVNASIRIINVGKSVVFVENGIFTVQPSGVNGRVDPNWDGGCKEQYAIVPNAQKTCSINMIFSELVLPDRVFPMTIHLLGQSLVIERAF